MFKVRAATKQDIAAVDALLARAYPRLLKPDYPASMLVMALPKISRAQPDLVTCGTYYLVEDEDRLLGAGGWTATPPGARKDDAWCRSYPSRGDGRSCNTTRCWPRVADPYRDGRQDSRFAPFALPVYAHRRTVLCRYGVCAACGDHNPSGPWD